jgi:hypothetical protein
MNFAMNLKICRPLRITPLRQIGYIGAHPSHLVESGDKVDLQ